MDELILGIDSTAQTGSVFLSRGETLLAESLLNVRSTHSERLLSCVDQLCQQAGIAMKDLHALAAVVGPGSFTGLRTGLATVKALSLALGLPVVTATSLELLGHALPYASCPVACMIDARKKQVYAALYGWHRGGMETILAPRVVNPELLLEKLKGDCLFVGDGAMQYRSLIVRSRGDQALFAPVDRHQVRASFGLGLFLERLRNGETFDAHSLRPLYIRPSDAELGNCMPDEIVSIEG